MIEHTIHPLIKESRIFFTVGVWDALSAKIAERAGFKAVVVSGYAVAASLLGEPDIGLLTQTEILDTARRIINAVKIPVIVDGDTGYGGALNTIRMVRELVRMGAAGVLFEDQSWPKRCGHMQGKSVIDMEEHIRKIRAAVESRGSDHLVITARTDALATHGVEEAVRRGCFYKEAGADVIFVDAPTSVEELRIISSGIPGPIVVNMIEGGKTPLLPLEELHEMGFISVGYPLTGIFAAAKAIEKTYMRLIEKGSSLDILSDLMQFQDFTSLVGLEERYRIDEKYR